MMLDFLLRHTAMRRLCSLVLLGALCLASIALLPLAALLGGLDALVHGRRGGPARAARFAAFAGAYLTAEVTGLCRVLRLRRSDQDAHYALLNRLLNLLYRTSRRAFRLRVLPPEQGLDLPDGPLLVFSRHAGPGDSFLLAYGLLEAGRRPRIVAKQVMRFDPLIDVLLGRLPNCFVGGGEPARAEAACRISELSGSLGPRDALLMFPEGGNFTAERRKRLIYRLRRRRDRRVLPTATSLSHVLPAHESGVFAAVDGAPAGATAVFVAHTGLDRLETAAETWSAVPLRRPLRFAWWAVPVAEIPEAEQARQTWLKRQWARIDAWIEHERRGEDQRRPTAANIE